MSYQKVTGSLMANSHPGSYCGQDAYNDMFVTEEMRVLHRKRADQSGNERDGRSLKLHARSTGCVDREREREREWRHPSEDLLNVNVNASRVFQTIGQTLGNGQTLRVSYTKKVLRVRDISHLATQLQRRFGSISPEGSALNMNET